MSVWWSLAAEAAEVSGGERPHTASGRERPHTSTEHNNEVHFTYNSVRGKEFVYEKTHLALYAGSGGGLLTKIDAQASVCM